MEKPKTHHLEDERLKALESLNLLDTLPEKEFDELTFLASHICDTPIALISLVDQNRQWFKSKIGLDVQETPKHVAFCAHALLQKEVFVVPDASKDKRFYDNPLVTGFPNVAFYAGAPLLDPKSKLPIGTLCVIDNKPRNLNSSQIKALHALSNQITNLLELRIKVQSLNSTNEKLIFQKTAFDNMTEGVVLQDKTGRIVDYNNAALEVLGLTADQLVGKTSMDPDWHSIRENGTSFPGEEHPAMQALTTAKPQKNIVMGIETQRNSVKWISINSTPIFLLDQKSPSHSVTTFSDITNVKKAQQALFQSAKMTSLGEMAGGIAHEINTPLAIILSAAQQIMNHLSVSPINLDKAKYKIKKIESTAQRISEIIRGLRTFSRNSTSDPWQLTPLLQIVSETTSLCQEKLNYSGVKLSLNLSQDLFVNCIPTQLSQVLLNLLNNAYDAVIDQSEKWIKVELQVNGQTAQLRITDSGPGISEEVVQKMMQPFFTTKQVGKGTGLGLSISKSIAESFNGRLFYEKNKENTSFVLQLPVANENQKVRVA